MITVRIKGLRKVERLYAQLPQAINKQILRVSDVFMKEVQKSAKLRAPVETGFLKDQIQVRKRGKQIILDTGEAYYAYYQEFGFAPHIIPKEYFAQHVEAPNIPGRFVRRPSGFTLVSKHKPFIFPALEINLSKLPNMLLQATKKAISKARR